MEVFPVSGKCLKSLIGIVMLASIVAAAVATVILFLDKKKKDEEELEQYLDCAIE